MKDNDKNYCDGILNSALYLERRNDGIILLDGVKYIYFVQPLRDNIQLVFLVDATHYVTLVKKQYPFGIFCLWMFSPKVGVSIQIILGSL